MSYTPHTWRSAELVTAAKLNAIEQGVAEVASSYTPHTWQNNEQITAEKMNNIEQAISSVGGGGSSDFTEKTITLIVTNTDEQHYTYFTYGIYEGVIGLTGEVTALVESNDKWCLADTVYMNPVQVTEGTHTINLLMTSDGELQFFPDSGKVLSVSGDIELVQDEDDYYLVTGNCTINVDINPA